MSTFNIGDTAYIIDSGYGIVSGEIIWMGKDPEGTDIIAVRNPETAIVYHRMPDFTFPTRAYAENHKYMLEHLKDLT